MRFIAALLMLFLATPTLAQAPDSVIQSRLIPFLQALEQPSPLRRQFIEANMTPELIELRGLDALSEAMLDVGEQLGSFEVVAAEVHGNAVTAVTHLRDTGDWTRVVLPLGPAPDFRIDGIGATATDPPAGFVPEADVDTMTDVLSEYMNSLGADGFSGAVIVAYQDSVLYAGAFGLAERDPAAHNTLLTPFNIGPLSSMLTVVMIMALVEEEKLDLRETVGKYLPQWPNQRVREEVTLSLLLTHYAGIPDTDEARYVQRRMRLREVGNHAALFADRDPKFTPGSQFEISTNGLILLARIAEAATGQDYATLMQTYVYDRASMRRSGHFPITEIGECCAIGYQQDGQPNTDLLPAVGSPAAGGYATAFDLAQFSMALMTGKILPVPTVERLFTPIAIVSPRERFALAGYARVEAGVGHIGYRSGGPGWGVDFSIYPDQAFTIIVLSNQDNGAQPVGAMLRRIIRQVMD